jgi:hypothetical protein
MTTARPIPSARRSPALLLMAFALALILAACGGGGGGGGASVFKLNVAVINETLEPAAVTFDVAGVPGEPETLDSCRGTVLTFDLPADDDWALAINGQIAIDSTTLDANLEDRNLVSEVTLLEDGTIQQKYLSVGGRVGRPSQAGICI